MSPELLDPQIQDHRRTVYSDCYALGMVIYEVLSERAPFYRYSNLIISGMVIRGDRPERPKGAEGGWFTDDVWEVLKRCWVPQPGDRPSIKDVLQCLEKVSKSWTPALVPPIYWSPTQESSDITALKGVDVRGRLPLEAAPHQSPVKLGREEATGINNGVRWTCPKRALVLTRSPIRLHVTTLGTISLVRVIRRLRRVCKEGPP